MKHMSNHRARVDLYGVSFWMGALLNVGPSSCVDSGCDGLVEWLDGTKLDCSTLDCTKVRTMEPGRAVYFSESTRKIADYLVYDPRAVICEAECSGGCLHMLTRVPSPRLMG